MSRRESLVGGEVVAEDVAEQAEKKRKQDEQRAAARAKRKRGGSGHGKATTAKAGTQGSEKEAEERRVKTEKLPLFDKENLKYDGEQVEWRTVSRVRVDVERRDHLRPGQGRPEQVQDGNPIRGE